MITNTNCTGIEWPWSQSPRRLEWPWGQPVMEHADAGGQRRANSVLLLARRPPLSQRYHPCRPTRYAFPPLLPHPPGRSLGQFVDLMKKCDGKVAIPDVVITAVGTKVGAGGGRRGLAAGTPSHRPLMRSASQLRQQSMWPCPVVCTRARCQRAHARCGAP